MTETFKAGDKVQVLDKGLARLRELCPGLPPNHHGEVSEIWDDGTLIILFDDTESIAPYSPELVRQRNE